MANDLNLAFEGILVAATVAGQEALAAAKPTPMVIGQPKSLFSNEIDYTKGPMWVEDEGPCGFAWVHIAGNTPFGRYVKKQGYASPDYPKGLMFWVRDGGQSMERKRAYARAFSEVLNANGVPAYSCSRMD